MMMHRCPHLKFLEHPPPSWSAATSSRPRMRASSRRFFLLFFLSLSFSVSVSVSVSSSLRLREREREREMAVMESAEQVAGGAMVVVDIYPLSRYYFGAKDVAAGRDHETATDRLCRLKSNFAARGLRTSVYGVLLVELFEHPHVLVLQVRNSFFKLPGGRLRPGEQDVEGLRRKLSRKLSLNDDNGVHDEDWQIGECIGMWWRSEFETSPFPYLPPNIPKPKECIKLFLIRLPMTRQFVVPRNLKLLAVPLCQIHDNSEVYGPVISGIPHLLSKFSFNVIHAE